ncbi:ROK family transcriptional regulator [Oscillospiraceae bacterium MB08-C2-2]|nr:ROK family transcriptional regulator [Oscillospiraceae bacterium MB08-C2-2]
MELQVGMGEIKKVNTQNSILDIIRKNGEASKFDIKKISRYSMSTVLTVIEELERLGYIQYSRTGKSSVGRKPTLYTLNAEAGYFVGVEFNADEIHCVLLDFKLQVVCAKSSVILEADRQADRMLEILFSHISEMLDFLPSPEKVMGIGVGAPGYVTEESTILFYAYIADWTNINLRQLIEEHFHIPTYLDNNINLIALAHRKVTEDNQNFLLFSIRSGIRFGCVLNNEIYRGAFNLSGEVGHTTVYPSSRQCRCGRKGCLESEISNYAIINKLVEGISVGQYGQLWKMAEKKQENLTVSLFVRSVLAGHEESLELFDEICNYLGSALAQSINMMNPSLIYLRSALNEAGDLLMERLGTVIRKHSFYASLENFELRLSDIGPNAGAIGAAQFAMNNNFGYVSIPAFAAGLS